MKHYLNFIADLIAFVFIHNLGNIRKIQIQISVQRIGKMI